MATVISLKRRIQAAKNVSKTTKAMQMISASKMKKAQNAALSNRPYVRELYALINNAMTKLDNENFSDRYLKSNSNSGRELIVLIAPDKGLCGGLIAKLMLEYSKYMKMNRDKADVIVIGKKVEMQAARLSSKVIANFNFGTTTPTFDLIYPVMKLIDEYYLGGKVDKVKVFYTDFVNFFSQIPTLKTLLPIESLDEVGSEKKMLSYIYEPNAKEILPKLLRHHLEMSLYHFFLESFVSEQSSRMISMQNATNNANDIIEDLKLEYNKTRQTKITSELLDITGASIASV